MSLIIDPLALYERKGQVGEPFNFYLAASVANNQTIVAAQSGYRILILSMYARSPGATASVVTFQSDNTAITTALSMPLDTAEPRKWEPVQGCWHFKTATSEAFKVSAVTAGCNINGVAVYVLA